MNERVYCALTIDGAALSGWVAEHEVGGVDVSQDHVMGLELHYGSSSGERGATAIRLSRMQISPVRLLKPTDQTTPALYRAHAENRAVEGVFRMFRRDPLTGESVHFFDLTMARARIVSIASSALDPATGPDRSGFVDWVEFLPSGLTYTELFHSVEFSQSN